MTIRTGKKESCNETPRVFLASPIERLEGEWVEAAECMAESERIRDEYGHEEVVIVDTDHMPWVGGRYPNKENVEKIAQAIEVHGDSFRVHIKLADQMASVEDIIEDFNRRYLGQWEDIEQFAWNRAEDLGMIPDSMSSRYFDIDAYIRDLRCSGHTIKEGHVFKP